MTDTITLRAGDAEAEMSLVGAEPVRWRVGGRDLLWSRDPAQWSYSAPILFPVVGASKGGVVRVGGREHPMGQHGFARTSRFDLVEQNEASATLRLRDDAETRARYPFAFALTVTATLTPAALTLDMAAENPGEGALPYALGFHPAFLWPFDRADDAGHAVVFSEPEGAEVPEVAAGGLLARRTRSVPLDGTILPLSRDLFAEAMVFLEARSRRIAFRSPSGAGIALECEGFPHLAVWSREVAPFLSLEAWTGHADWEDAEGDLAARDSMILLAPGETGRHRVAMVWAPA